MEYLLIFLEGIASFISPCLLPMIPIYIAYFTGEKEKSLKGAVINSLGFVLVFTMVFMIPYLLFAVGYPFLFNSFKYITTSLSSFIDYAGGIIMPFAILGMLRVFKALMNNIKSKWPLGIVSVLVTIILFSVYIIAIYWMSYAESGMSFYLPIQMLLFYAEM